MLRMLYVHMHYQVVREYTHAAVRELGRDLSKSSGQLEEGLQITR